MKTKELPLFILIILAVLVGCSPRYMITDDLNQPIPVTATCNVGLIVDELPANFPAEKKPSAEQITDFKKKIRSALVNKRLFSDAGEGHSEAEYEVNGAILDYTKGDGFTRFMLGFGAGAARVTVNLNLLDKKTGAVLFGGNFTGSVTSWAEGGSAMFSRVADDFAKALKKQLKVIDKADRGGKEFKRDW